jgi:hypothetical protein
LQRIDHENGRIEIRSQHPGGIETISHWLHFQKEVIVIDENGEAKRCNIAIAYSLVEEANKKGEGSTWKIVPLEHGQVSIYFPAEKETSNLRFHLHAPFASTVARDSVRDCSANHQLRDGIAELIVESLISIRNQGLLTIGFLAVLPNPSDNLAGSSPFYEPIRKSIIQAFNVENLMPTRSGAHASIGRLYCGPNRIAEVLNDDDLSLLTSHAPPLWAANAPQKNQREDRFLDSLNIESWSWAELAYLISNVCDEEDEDDQELIEAWISGKDDSWLLRFYALLGEASDSHYEDIDVSDLRIVRVSTDVGNNQIIPRKAFFLLDGDDIAAPADILFVKKSVYAVGGSDTQKKFAKSFLESAGVAPYDAKACIQLMLEKYDSPPSQVDDSHYEDIKLFIAYYKKNSLEQGLFKNRTILLGISDENKLYWSKPEELSLDKPYFETGLSDIVSIHGKRTVWQNYQEKLNKNQTCDFIDFLRATGVMTGFAITKVSPYSNPFWGFLRKDSKGVKSSKYEINEDFSITNLKAFIDLQSIQCSLLIWNALINSNSNTAKARYRPNLNYGVREADSQLVHHLKTHAWISNKQGGFCYPKDISRDDLPDDFVYNNSNGLLTAIGFGENAKRRTEEYQAKNSKAQESGFKSAEEMEKYAELAKCGFSVDVFLAQQKHIELPEESAPNPERRRKNALEQSNNASSKESILRERSIQLGITNIVADAKAYLREKYTNINKELVCQCCQKEMPFKVNDAYYFEAVQCIKELKKHLNENRLALCPTCAAMYQYARETDDAEMRRLIAKSDVLSDSSSIEIPITLAAKQYMLRFVETHWIDLKANVSPLND